MRSILHVSSEGPTCAKAAMMRDEVSYHLLNICYVCLGVDDLTELHSVYLLRNVFFNLIEK